MKITGESVTSNFTMDIRNLIAPVTLLKVENRLATMERGQILEIICLDRETRIDLARIAKNAGHGFSAMQNKSDKENAYRIFIERR